MTGMKERCDAGVRGTATLVQHSKPSALQKRPNLIHPIPANLQLPARLHLGALDGIHVARVARTLDHPAARLGLQRLPARLERRDLGFVVVRLSEEHGEIRLEVGEVALDLAELGHGARAAVAHVCVDGEGREGFADARDKVGVAHGCG